MISHDSSQIPEISDNTRYTILIVDDRYENRYYLETLLKGNGFQVLSAKNGDEAIKILKSNDIDLIITDILMPGIDGYMLCQTVKKEPKLTHIPLIFHTASYIEPRHVQFGLSLGAVEYVCKPAEPDDLLVIIKRILNQKK